MFYFLILYVLWGAIYCFTLFKYTPFLPHNMLKAALTIVFWPFVLLLDIVRSKL